MADEREAQLEITYEPPTIDLIGFVTDLTLQDGSVDPDTLDDF